MHTLRITSLLLVVTGSIWVGWGGGGGREWTFVPLCFTENLGKPTQQSNFTSPLTLAGRNAQVFAHQPPKVLRRIPL